MEIISGVINIAFSYSAQEEIASAITETVQETTHQRLSARSDVPAGASPWSIE
jgi:hypothetical protein